jgi:hypothetical protein
VRAGQALVSKHSTCHVTTPTAKLQSKSAAGYAGNTYCKLNHSEVTEVIQHYLVEQLLTARQTPPG